MISFKAGNLFKEFSTQDRYALAHGVNCRGVMGAGIAVEFKRRYPEMFLEYERRCRAGALSPGDCFPWDAGNHTVYNLATQAGFGDASLVALEKSLLGALDHALVTGVGVIGMPAIGCGLGGLVWNDVRNTIVAIWNQTETPINLVVFDTFAP